MSAILTSANIQNVVPIFGNIFPHSAGDWKLIDACGGLAYGVMTVEEWTALPDLPGYRASKVFVREEAERLEKQPAFRDRVQMAELPDGRRYKIDGHLRGKAWEIDALTRPEHLVVMLHRVEILQQVIDIRAEWTDPEAIAFRR